MATIIALDVIDVRFPTSRTLDGSDAMNPDPDYSAAYVDPPRPTPATVSGARAHVHDRPRHRGRRRGDRGARGRWSSAGRRRSCSRTWARSGATLVGDSQLRWLGPEKGVIHLATAAVVNAVWDLFAKRAGKPLWRLARRHDARGARRARRLPLHHRRADARARPRRGSSALAPTRAEREAELRRDGYPAYTTSAGWLGYADDKVRRLCREALADGLDALQDQGRARTSRTTAARPDRPRGDRPERDADGRRQPALGRRRGDRVDGPARRVRPVLDRGADQPRRHPRPRGDRPGRRADPGRDRRARPQPGDVQAAAPGRGDRASARSTRAGSAASTRSLAVLLLAAKFGVPVCPHAGGVGLCEHVQHLSIVDYVVRERLARGPDDRVRRPPPRALPRSGRDPRRRATSCRRMPGYSGEMRPESLARYRFPDGDGVATWSRRGRARAPRGGQMKRLRPADPRPRQTGSKTTSGSTPRRGPGSSSRSAVRTSATTRSSVTAPICSRTSNTSATTSTADMAAMAADETTRRWWSLTEAMQEPLADREPGAWWTTIDEVFHTD